MVDIGEGGKRFLRSAYTGHELILYENSVGLRTGWVGREKPSCVSTEQIHTFQIIWERLVLLGKVSNKFAAAQLKN